MQVKDLVPGFEKEIDTKLKEKQEREAKRLFKIKKEEVAHRQRVLDNAIAMHQEAVEEYEKLLAVDISDLEIKTTSDYLDISTLITGRPLIPTIKSSFLSPCGS